jgi:hypothetical protein
MWNPQARAELLHCERDPSRPVWVLNNALADPNALRELAIAHWPAFAQPSANAFPGFELPLPEQAAWGFAQGMLDGVSPLAEKGFGFGSLRVLSATARLSVVTLQAAELSPIQRLCHRDRLAAPPGSRVLAGVLYLALGGTNFFEPRQPTDADRLMQRAASMTHADLDAAIGANRGYMLRSTPWFDWVGEVAPQFNRLVVYDGARFHGSAIHAPQLLNRSAETGRLAINVFAVCG